MTMRRRNAYRFAKVLITAMFVCDSQDVSVLDEEDAVQDFQGKERG